MVPAAMDPTDTDPVVMVGAMAMVRAMDMAEAMAMAGAMAARAMVTKATTSER